MKKFLSALIVAIFAGITTNLIFEFTGINEKIKSITGKNDNDIEKPKKEGSKSFLDWLQKRMDCIVYGPFPMILC